MVAASRDSSSSQQQHPQQPQQLQAVLPVEDEALKRNTDCVYFLASPLTCKKGIECEYRHSEEARMNPRDCYYWLNGNCLNPKCAFRHPPLDGLIGTQTVGLTGPSLPTSQTAVPINANYNPGRPLAAASVPFNPVKQAVPCIFFFKGLCVKGDRCAFSHGLNPATNKFTRDPAAVPVHEPSSNLKKTFGGLQKCSNEPKPQTNLQKPNHEVVPKAKPAPTLETALSNNRNFGQKIDLAPGRFNGGDSGHFDTHFSQVTNGNNTMVWSNHMHQADVSDDQSLPNGSKDADDFYKESSPGFDVLVDDELRDTEYYHNEDQFGRRGHEGRNLTEFDVGGSSDYNRVADADREIIADPRGYDSYDRTRGKHDWNQRRDEYLPDRKSSDPLERRRGYVKSVSPNQIEESDLRYRLSKQRRVNGLKSVISHDYSHRNHDEERRYGDSSRDSRHLSSNERSHSSRLRGRLSIPSRSNDNNVRSDRDMDRERSFNRFSPGRPQSLSHQGRLPDRLRGRVQDDFHRRDRMPDARTDFSGPKSLAELKVGKNGDGKEKQLDSSLGKRKHSRNYQPSEEDLSFDGPKPLSEILKRKRGDTEPVTVVEDVNPPIKTDSAHVEPHVESHVESQVVDSTTAVLEPDEGGPEEDQYELEEYDQNDAELDEADYNLEEGDNAYQEEEEEEEYLEEEDGEDDFAKKIGVMFS